MNTTIRRWNCRQRTGSGVCLGVLLMVCGSPGGVRAAPPRLAPDGVRPLPTGPSAASGPGAPGYCASAGGSTAYEFINELLVTLNPDGNTVTITVNVVIANPTGCTAGNPCPEYDSFPENVNVWIDWNGNSAWEAGEKVLDQAGSGYLNINYQGTMTFVAQATIPAGAMRPTWARSNLGWSFDPNDPCTPGWTWGNVVDRRVMETVQVVRLDATNDVPIRDITDPVWRKQYNAQCKLEDTAPVENDPIADDMASGTFKITAMLAGCPANPAWMPKVKWSYEVVLNGGTVGTRGNGEFTAWSGMFDVTLPRQVNDATLKLAFDIFDNNNRLIAKQTIDRPLYIILDTPNAAVRPPKLRWLQKATEWARTAADAAAAMPLMRAGIYTGHGGWVYEDFSRPWTALVEGTSSVANCVTYSDVWNGLMRVLGAAGTGTMQTRGSSSEGFITNTGVTALDGKTGNAHPAGMAIDRWRFGMHQVGTGGGAFQDPTMGQQYATLTAFISWHATGAWFTEPVTLRRRQNYTGGHRAYRVSTAAPWSDYEYHSPGFENPAPGGEAATFTGTHVFSRIDDDGDGRYEALTVDVEINVAAGGDFMLDGSVLSGGTTVSSRPSWFAMQPSSVAFSSGSGLVTVSLTFSGEEISQGGLDGPYDVVLFLGDSAGLGLEEATYATEAYLAASFGELPARLGGSTDALADRDGDLQDDAVQLLTDIESFKNQDFSLDGVLMAGGEVMSFAGVSGALTTGLNTVELLFDGNRLRDEMLDGPYTVQLFLQSAESQQIDEATVITGAYSSGDFEPSRVALTGPHADSGVDTDFNGLFNSLAVDLSVAVAEAGTYELTGWLEDGASQDLAWAAATPTLALGPQIVTLSFPGIDINAHGVNGPYAVRYVVVKTTLDEIVSSAQNVHTTGAYLYTQFEADQPLVTATNSFSDAGVDADFDGLFDTLRVNVGVRAGQAGNVVATARLVDVGDGEIQWATNFVSLLAQEEGVVELNFSGRRVYAGLDDGPYHLMNLLVYHTGDPEQSIQIADAYSTSAYAHEQFECFGDTDADDDIDVPDFVVFFHQCFTGPFGGPIPPACDCSDADGDLDVDQDDFNVFAAFYTGLPGDCNANSVSDLADIVGGTSFDVDQNGEPDECAAGCTTNAQCNDGALCSLDLCDVGICENRAILYADVNSDDFVNVGDALCQLDFFAGNPFSPACVGPFGLADQDALDIAPCPSSGDPDNMGDGFVNVSDVLAALDVFAGLPQDPACQLCQGGPAAAAATLKGVTRLETAPVGKAIVWLRPDRRVLQPGQVVNVEAWVLAPVPDLRAYQLTVRADGAKHGSLVPQSAAIVSDRGDYVFQDRQALTSINGEQGALLALLPAGGVDVKQPQYLGTFQFRAADDAVGLVRVGLDLTPEASTLRSSASEPYALWSQEIVLIVRPGAR